MDECRREEQRMAEEDLIQERVDADGNIWKKVYFGGGTHFDNWLDQTIELCGRENVEVEETDPKGLQCFEQGNEKMYRIWVKKSASIENLT
jgi:hypothetical protein